MDHKVEALEMVVLQGTNFFDEKKTNNTKQDNSRTKVKKTLLEDIKMKQTRYLVISNDRIY